MSGIFVSYRREDSAGWTGRLADSLKEHFGPESIFMDIDGIELGTDFTVALHKALESCKIVLAMIGPEWATLTTSQADLGLRTHRLGASGNRHSPEAKDSGLFPSWWVERRSPRWIFSQMSLIL